MNDQQCEPLSPAGIARREAMLEELVEVVKGTHRARRRRRQALALGGCTSLLLALIWVGLPGASGPRDVPSIAGQPPEARQERAPAPEHPQRHLCVTTIVQTDPSVLERYRVQPTSHIVRMDDQMLLATLASINRPAGLIRFGDRVRLSAPVTDAELGLKQ